MSRKLERLMNLMIMLLNSPRPVTVDEIHETIPGYGQEQKESFKRMFERDKEELREAGIPLELTETDAWGLDEGYRIDKERYYLPQIELEEDEIAALWVAASLLRISDPKTPWAAMMKIAGDVPEGAPPQTPLTVDLGLAEPNLAKAFDAATDRKTITFLYRGGQGSAGRKVDPYRLSHRKGVWYLAGRDHDRDDVRTFRLDRIEGTIRILDPSRPGPQFEVPTDFDETHTLDFPPFVQGEVEVRAIVSFDADTAWLVERSSPWVSLEWDPDGSARASLDITDTQGFVSWVLWFDQGAEVLSPPELREKVRERLEGICA